MCFRVCLQFIALKTENRHYANFVITGSIEGRYNGKLPNVTTKSASWQISVVHGHLWKLP